MSVEARASLLALAGPNGAGKTTAGPELLRDTLGITELVNADLIAQGLSPFAPQRASVAAGRIMVERLRELARRRVSFAFETTLAGRAYAPWIAGLVDRGYLFHLLFLWLPSPEHAIARVADRVRRGGHAVPDEVVRRRYYAGLRNFFRLYRPLATAWRVYENAEGRRPRLVAMGRATVEAQIFDEVTWRAVQRGNQDGDQN